MNCEKASLLAQRLEDNSLSFFDKLKLRLHVLLCGPCRWFNHQNNVLNKAIEKIYVTDNENKKKLSQKRKDDLLKKINDLYNQG